MRHILLPSIFAVGALACGHRLELVDAGPEPDVAPTTIDECTAATSCQAYEVLVAPASRSPFFVDFVRVAADGRVYVVGRMKNATLRVGGRDFATGTMNPGGSAYDAFVISLTPAGEPDWAFFDTPESGSSVGGIALAPDGIYLAITRDGTSASSIDATSFVVRLASDGSERWRTAITSPGVIDAAARERPIGLAARAAGGVVVSGSYVETLDVGGVEVPGGTMEQGFVAALDDAGGVVWTRIVTGDGGVLATGAASLGDGTVAIILQNRAPGPTTFAFASDSLSIPADATEGVVRIDDAGSVAGFVPLTWPALAQYLGPYGVRSLAIDALQYELGNSRTWRGFVDYDSSTLTGISRVQIASMGFGSLGSGTLIHGTFGYDGFRLDGFTTDGLAWQRSANTVDYLVQRALVGAGGSRAVVAVEHETAAEVTVIGLDLPF